MDLSLQKLTQALSLRQQISALEERLGSLFGTGPSKGGRRRRSRKRRPMSAATRAKLAAAAKARWAKQKHGPTVRRGKASTPGKTKGGLTAAGRRKLSEAMKARWKARRKTRGEEDPSPERPPTGNPGTFMR